MHTLQMLQTTVPEQERPDPRLTVAIPCYNEARYVGAVVAGALKQAATVVVIDDGSQDDTARLATDAGAMLITHLRNEGKGAAINTAFDYARESGTQVLVLMDGDGQHEPSLIHQVAAPVLEEHADVCVGSRFMARGNAIPAYRRLGQHILTLVTNIGSGVHITDSQSGFRAFSRRAIESLSFEQKGLAVESEMQFHFSRLGLSVTETPITTNYDDRPKRNPAAHGFGNLFKVIGMIARWRPLLLFGMVGFALLLAAGIMAALTQVGGAMARIAGALRVGAALAGLVGGAVIALGLALHVSRQRRNTPK